MFGKKRIFYRRVIKLQERIIQDLKVTIASLIGDSDDTFLDLVVVINNSKYILMDISLVSNQKVLGTLVLRTSSNQAVVEGSVFSNISVAYDGSFFTANVDQTAGTIEIVGIKDGVTNLTIDADVTYTNSLGEQVTEHKQKVVAVTLSVPARPEATELDINFGSPIAQ